MRRLFPRLTFTTLTGAYALTVGAITVLGWVLSIERWTDWAGSGITMKFNTALCALLTGIVLLAVSQGNRGEPPILIRMLAGAIVLIAGLTLFEHVTGINLGIDTLVVDEAPGAVGTPSPGRMGLPASISFLTLGVALLLLTGSRRRRRWAASLTPIPAFIALLSMVGYMYGANQLYRVPQWTGIAWQTATVLVVAAIGVMNSVPEYGLAAAVRRADAGGVMIRRLLVAVIFTPVLIGWVRVLGEHNGLYDSAFGSAIRTIFEIGIFVALLWWTSNGISRQAAATAEAERALRAADQRKDEFLATLAHELRGPLAPMRNMLEVMKRTSGDSQQEQRARVTMDRQLRHLTRLVDDLLDLSRITHDKMELRLEPTDFTAVLRQSVDASRPLFEERGLTLVVDAPPEGASIPVRADAIRLSQVFGNLLNNAAKYTNPPGRIVVTAGRDDRQAIASIRDDGIGIPPEQLAHVFEMFGRGTHPTTGPNSGLGIGLALVRRLVEMHGGSVHAASDGPGRGSTFVVRLPLQ